MILKADIEYWKDSIINDIDIIQSMISSIPSITNSLEKSDAISKVDKVLRNSKNNTRSFKMEIRLLSDPNERSRYERDLSNFDKTLQSLASDIKSLQSEGKRNSLFIGANHDQHSQYGVDDPHKAGDALLSDATRIQDKTQTSLSTTQNLIAESKQVGMSTVEELHRQREQLGNIDSDVNRMEDNLKRADRLIKTFGKRMATDKMIQCFACVNVMIMVGLIVYSVVKGGLNSKDEDVVPPQSPV